MIVDLSDGELVRLLELLAWHPDEDVELQAKLCAALLELRNK